MMKRLRRYLVVSFLSSAVFSIVYEAKRFFANQNTLKDAPEYIDDANLGLLAEIQRVFWRVVAFRYWGAVFIGLAVLLLIWAYMRYRRNKPQPKDDTRAFTQAERDEIFRRASGRCEHRYLFFFRCRKQAGDADHVYPHTLGGQTIVENGSALCAHHNRSKGGKMPSRYYVFKLEFWRKFYYPKDISPKVLRSLPIETASAENNESEVKNAWQE
jgi:hypothetical protein